MFLHIKRNLWAETQSYNENIEMGLVNAKNGEMQD